MKDGNRILSFFVVCVCCNRSFRIVPNVVNCTFIPADLDYP